MMNNNIISGIYVFEGIDGVGKTTVISELCKKLIDEKLQECICLSFPGKDPKTLGGIVYDIHHNTGKYFDQPLNEISLQLLHVASHIDIITRELIDKTATSRIVLLDRFWWSTYAYGLAGGISLESIEEILKPELSLWRNINIKKVFLIERPNRTRIYDENKEKYIIEIYKKLGKSDSKCTVVNNAGSIEQSVNQIYNIILGDIANEV